MTSNSYLYRPFWPSAVRPPIVPDGVYVNFPEFPENGGSVFCQISLNRDLNQNYVGDLTWYDAATLKLFEVTHWLYSFYVPQQGYRFSSYQWDLLNDDNSYASFDLTPAEVEEAFNRFGIAFQAPRPPRPAMPFRERTPVTIRNWGIDSENADLLVLAIRDASAWRSYVHLVQGYPYYSGQVEMRPPTAALSTNAL